MLLVEVAPGDIDPQRLTACQRDAASGLYAEAMAGYIARLAPKLDQVRAEIKAACLKYREQAALERFHRRTPGIVGDLFIGWEWFLGFAHETEALTRGEAEAYRARVWSALIEVARRQSELQREANPVDRFFALLRSGIAAGRAHVATRHGGAPAKPKAGLARSRPRAQPSRGGVVSPRHENRMAGWRGGPFPRHRLRLPRCRADAR
jgi:hypothetical protein